MRNLGETGKCSNIIGTTTRRRPTCVKAMPSSEQDYKKVVIVGDGFCGKTSLLARFTRNEFRGDYVPTVFDTEIASVIIDGREICLSLWDTAGQEAYERLRPLSYTDTDVAIIAYSVADRDTMTNVVEKWFVEICHYLPQVPVLLIGTKLDLRPAADELDRRFVSEDDGRRLAGYIGADDFAECSALANVGVTEVFYKAALLTMQRRRRRVNRKNAKKKRCTLL